MFEASFNATLSRYRNLLNDTGEGTLQLENDNFDVGENTGPGKYRMNDDVHAKLLDEWAKANFTNVTSEAKAELLRFYADPDAPNSTKRNAKAWAKVQMQLLQLQAAPVVPLTAESVEKSDGRGEDSFTGGICRSVLGRSQRLGIR